MYWHSVRFNRLSLHSKSSVLLVVIFHCTEMNVNEISKYLKIFENELYDKNYWQLPFDQIISVHLCGFGEIKKKGKVMKQQIKKFSLKHYKCYLKQRHN